jgi:alkylated DNA repair dioxygenase AlkB
MIPGLEVEQGALELGEVVRLQEAVEAELESVLLVAGHERSRVRRYGWDYLEAAKWQGRCPEALYARGVYVPVLDPDQFESVTVNEYPAGHGLALHKDSALFGEPVVVVSLGAAATMIFESDRGEEQRVLIKGGTVVRMSRDSRWKWRHGMEADNKGVRWSVVYRHRT